MVERDDSVAAPSCPLCGGPLVLRRNRRDGSPFWGCRRFPSCRGTRDVTTDAGVSGSLEEPDTPTQFKVLWNDATLDRAGWQCRYTTAGGRLRSSPSLTPISNEFRQCWLARSATLHVAPESIRRVTGALRKLIQRGSNPPIHPETERVLLGSLGLDDYVRRSPLPGDISVRLEPDVFQNLSTGGLSLHEPDYERDEEVRLESGHEHRFLTGWVPHNLGPEAPRWFVPQASFDALTAALGGHSRPAEGLTFWLARLSSRRSLSRSTGRSTKTPPALIENETACWAKSVLRW